MSWFKDYGTTSHVAEIIPCSTKNKLETFEAQRVAITTTPKPFKGEQLIDFITSKKGPRICVMNTVQSAAVLAHLMRSQEKDVIHLSTALAPSDRSVIVKKIKDRLKGPDNNWTLVATSCVEAGIDLSFRVGFRERCHIFSLLQIAGRVNRNNEYSGDCLLYDFFMKDKRFKDNPEFNVSSFVLEKLFKEEKIGRLTPEQLSFIGMDRECKMKGNEDIINSLIKLDKAKDFPGVSENYKVINDDTHLVIVNEDLCKKMESGYKASNKELLKNSVQLWLKKVERFGLRPLKNFPDIYFWGGRYDPNFLGIMIDVVPIVLNDPNFFIV